jgi:cyanophycinase
MKIREKKTESGNPGTIPKGRLLIIGGAESKGLDDIEDKDRPDNFVDLEILKTLVKLTGKEDPQIELITTATSKPEETYEDYKKGFSEIGVTRLGQIHHRTRKDVLQDDFKERLNNADGIFFSGGDQLLLSSNYGGTDFLKTLKERYINEEIVIAGTSAGAMAMSTPMIFAGSNEVQQIAGEIKVTTGLEFLRDVCIDTHFVHRGRFIRLAQVIATNPTCIGIGIEEDTAIVVRNGEEVEVIGTGTVIIFEGFDITYANVDEFTSKKPITIKDLRVHILSKGDTYLIREVNPIHK